jgi:hypothetical protein
MTLNIGKDLCFLRLSFGKLDMEIGVHVWNGKDNLLGGSWLRVSSRGGYGSGGRGGIRF